ncbi:MAG: hypothetical protein ABW175_21490 [Bradyrhizobium sp.]
MSKKWTLLTLMASLVAPGALHAGSLDSPDVVYIDGQPCNSACQSYMTWSARAHAARYRGHYEERVHVAVPEEEFDEPAPVRPSRMTRKPAAPSHTMSRSAMPMPKPRAAAARNDVSPRAAAAPAGMIATAAPPPAAMEAPAAARPTITVESIRAAAAPPPAAMDAPAAAKPTITVESIRAAAAASGSASAPAQDNLVALVLAPQDINSLSDLNNKRIAIAEKQSALSGRVSAALMAAGAAEVQFSEAKDSAIDRLTNGEVPAAVVLAPREIAALFPEMAGYRTFRIPLAQKAPM